MGNSKVAVCFWVTFLFLCWAELGCSMSRRLTEVVAMEFVRVDYEEEVKALIIEMVVPEIDTINDLSRIELLVSHDNAQGIFGVILNYGDRLDPIPPGNFGVIIDPASDDRSIKNVSSAAGIPGRWDHPSSHGKLLKQSTREVVNGNLGISIWIAPQDWNPGHYTIKARAVKWKQLPAPWQKLAEFDYTGKGLEKGMQSTCLIKPIFINISNQAIMPFDRVRSITLIRYEEHSQDKGVTITRWAGDTASQYKYVEKEKRKLKLNDFPEGLILLAPGIYQIEHNSVKGVSGMTSGCYGKSNYFDIKPESKMIEVRIPLYPAI